MLKVYLIDEAYLKTTVNVTSHKDANEIKIAFKTVEEFYITDLLSIPLYELYVNHVTNGTELTPRQADLFPKIKLYYALLVQYELMFNLFTVTNKGNEQSQNAPSITDIREKRNEVMSKAETVKARILEYLSKNKADFPEYYAGSQGNDTPSSDASGFSPIVFY
ncbi:hypothetical protein EFA69_06555 [Rufibacter immobilis]|uniref:Uncharacterized protein n=1 Tax=Rufibacter immobilis TaxID=1348778 RepID=A0A3M9N1P1_9BACT|nr:hypothetical protein [Rufibacter immobilis]RNI30948.1 hypothetical protein EFA69_06555 [Rufibacter immobilis]